MTNRFWQGKRVFITGHTGFKGSWLALWLQHLGAEVTGYALQPPTSPALFNVARVAEDMTSIIGDVCDPESLKAALHTHQPEVILHMAAQPIVLIGYQNPVETYQTNVMGTVNLLEAARYIDSLRAVVIVTTDKCYDNRSWYWGYRENEPMGGHDPYASSKGCAELVTAAYRDSFFAPQTYDQHRVAIASARAGNVIGGGDWAANRLIPDFMRAMMAGEPVIVRHPGAIRPWQHVLEPLAGYLQLAQHLIEQGTPFAEAWNFGPYDQDAKPVSWILDRLINLWEGDASWELDAVEHPPEDKYLKLDCSKARAKLGWYPRLNLETSLGWIVDWYQAYQAKADMRRFTERQIIHYEEDRVI